MGNYCKILIIYVPKSLQLSIQPYILHIILVIPSVKTLSILVPSEVDLGNCLVGGIQATQLLVKNEGGPGRFCLMTKNKWPTTSIRVSDILL